MLAAGGIANQPATHVASNATSLLLAPRVLPFWWVDLYLYPYLRKSTDAVVLISQQQQEASLWPVTPVYVT